MQKIKVATVPGRMGRHQDMDSASFWEYWNENEDASCSSNDDLNSPLQACDVDVKSEYNLDARSRVTL